MQAVLNPASERPKAAYRKSYKNHLLTRSPAPPAPTTIASYVWSITV